MAALYMLVLGLGLGMVMQVLVLAAQNAVDYEYLGVATSGSTLFRQIGGSIGVAAFGAIFANQLAKHLAHSFPAGVALPAAPNPAAIAQLPPAAHTAYVTAITDALTPVFLIAAGLALLAFGLTWLLREVPLKTTSQAPDVGDGFHASHDDSGLREIERALTVLAPRRAQTDEQFVLRADVQLRPPEPPRAAAALITESQLNEELPVGPDRIAGALGAARARRR